MRTVAIFLTLLCGACASSTDSGSTSLDLKGTWQYAAVQTAPALNISGTLNIDQQKGGTFSGTVQFTETDVQGTVRTRTGQLNGNVVGSDAVDFDVFIDNIARRHVARVVADSMNGTWAYTGTGAGITGSFTGKRIR